MKMIIRIFILLFMGLNVNCFGAEFLVIAKYHWLSNVSEEEKSKWTPEQWKEYERRITFGDIIVIKPDGWKWGKEECLPRFVVIKIIGLSYKDAKMFNDSLLAEDKTIKKRKKYCFADNVVNDVISNGGVVEYNMEEEVIMIGEKTE